MYSIIENILARKIIINYKLWVCPYECSDFSVNNACCYQKASIISKIISIAIIWCHAKIYACYVFTLLATQSQSLGNTAFLKLSQVTPVPATLTGFGQHIEKAGMMFCTTFHFAWSLSVCVDKRCPLPSTSSPTFTTFATGEQAKTRLSPTERGADPPQAGDRDPRIVPSNPRSRSLSWPGHGFRRCWMTGRVGAPVIQAQRAPSALAGDFVGSPPY